jgi:hypothetical protein
MLKVLKARVNKAAAPSARAELQGVRKIGVFIG